MNNCPPDVFSMFDEELCSYNENIGLTVNPIQIDGAYRESFIFVEMPFLPNQDAEYIAGLPETEQNAAVKLLAYNYALDEDRRFMLEVRDEFAESSCPKITADDPLAGTIQDPNCTCFPVGFDDPQ